VALATLGCLVAASHYALSPAAAANRTFAPARGAIVAKPPVLDWKRVAGARFYNVQLHRNGKKILSRWPSKSRFDLHWKWKTGKRTYRLRSAAYQWYVWPHYRSGYGRRVVRSWFSVGRLPAVVTPPIITGLAREGALLTSSGGRWTGTRPRSLRYQWERCDSTGKACEPMPGEHSSSVLLTAADIDATIRVVVTAANWLGERSARSSTTQLIRPAPPVLAAPPKLIGSPQVGNTLTAEVGAWSSSRPITYSVHWRLCTAEGCKRLQTSERALTLGASTLERTVHFVVTATNGGGDAQAASPRSARIGLRLVGSRAGDRLVGSGGSDIIRGLNGGDVLIGKTGSDQLVGGRGSDRMRAGSGDDRVAADDSRRDLIDCGAGSDVALVDKRDVVSDTCEIVRRRR
jgi:RTX calcium-binding nonapeptide repeat (4 copies)